MRLGVVRRFVPFLRMSKRPPPVSFPDPEIGRGFGLESAMFIVVKSFNGYWKAMNGAKELCKAQESLPQWKKLHHRMDGPIRFLLVTPPVFIKSCPLNLSCSWTATEATSDWHPGQQ